MEVIKNNQRQSLTANSNRKSSYIKPPIAPKPKVIPKPKGNYNKCSIKILNVNSARCKSVISVCDKPFSDNIFKSVENTELSTTCSSLSSVSEEISVVQNISESVNNNINIQNVSECVKEISVQSVNPYPLQEESVTVICHNNSSESRIDDFDSSCSENVSEQKDIDLSSSSEQKEIDLNSSNDSSISIDIYCNDDSSSTESSLKLSEKVSPDDVCSSLMEKALENCTGLSSKSSSNSSISYGDSDSDEFTPSVVKKRNPSIIITKAYDNSSSDSSSITNLTASDSETNNNNNISNKKLFLVAQEMKTSEKSFVAILKLLNVDFKQFLVEKDCLCTKEKNNKNDALPQRHFNEVFKYLPNLQSLNEGILSDFEIRINNWERHPKIADVIVRKGPFLKLYANYIKELEVHTRLLQRYANQYPYFGECLREFENSEQGYFIPVSKHMLTPMQRITKYRELMKQYIKYLNESHIDYSDALQALEIVKGVAEHANEAIRELENSARLLCLQERLNGISAAEGTNSVSSSSGGLQHLLVEPGKKLLKEGQLMKLCRRGVRIVYLILLSDSLLYTIEELHGGKNCPLKLRYKLPLEGMRVDIPVSEDFQNEFTVISTSRSFTIRANSSKERDEWITCLRNAIESNATRRYSFEKAKTADFEYLSLNVLGKQAPAWIPDNRVTMCQVCTSEFSLTFRRHHCRACGKVVCRYCSANRAPLEYLDNHCERVCDYCYDELLKALQEKEEKEDDIEDDQEREKYRKKLKIIRARFKKSLRDGRKCRLKKPERLLEVCGGDHESQICGYLRQFSRRTWRQSWFVLKDKVLYEYRAPEDVCALSSLPVLGYSVSSEFKSLEIFDGMDPANAFKLEHINQLPLIFYADSNELATKWRKTMEKEVVL